MKRFIIFLYGVISYVLFLVAFLYAIGFVGNMLVPKSIDSGLESSIGYSLLINLLLLSLFAIQHSVMARPWFKRAWTKIIPKPAERSTYVLLSSLILILMYWQWQPMTGVVWDISGSTGASILNILFWIGWGIVLTATFIINHFELFGLHQVMNYLTKKEFVPPHFTERGYYKHVRHPIMFGFLVAFWAAPTMTIGHLLFTVMTTGYIIVGVLFEENDLRNYFGQKYVQYAQRVPMLIPFTKIKPKTPTPTKAEQDTVLGEN